MQEKKDREENLRNDIFKEIEEKQKTVVKLLYITQAFLR